MIYQEAINILMNERPGCGEKVTYTEGEKCEAYDIAISAIEKQVTKKLENWNGQTSCPNCKKLYGNFKDIRKLSFWDFDYCKYCGQKLNWED